MRRVSRAGMTVTVDVRYPREAGEEGVAGRGAAREERAPMLLEVK